MVGSEGLAAARNAVTSIATPRIVPTEEPRMRHASCIALCLSFAACASTVRDEIQHASYLAHVAAADSALRLGELAEFRRWTQGAPENERNFEWRWLAARQDQSQETTALDVGPVLSLDVGPDDAALAVAAGDGTILVLERASKRELWRAKLHTDAVTSVRFDRRGERLVTASRDRTVKVWDAKSGALLVDFKKHPFPVWAAAFSADGSQVASCSYERPPGRSVIGSVRIWDARTGDELRQLEGGVKPLSSIEFSPDGKALACGSWGFCVYFWGLESGGEPRSFAMPDEGKYNAIDALEFSPDGTLVAAAAKDDTARVWRVADGELVASLRGHANFVNAIRFSPDGARIATAAADETLRLWNARDGSLAETLRGHTEGVRSLAFSRDGTRLVSGGNDGTLREWDPRSDAYDWKVLHATAAAYSSIFSKDGTRLFTCSYDGRVQIWSTATWALLANFVAHPSDKSCHGLALSPDGSTLYTASYDGTVGVFDTVTLEELGRLQHENGLYTLRLSPDGSVLAVAQMNGTVVTWDTTSRTKLGEIAAGKSACHDLGFSRDGRLLAACSDAKALGLWDVATHTLVRELELGTTTAHTCWFTRDGERLIVGDGSGNVHVWRTSDWSREHTIPCFNNSIDRLSESPDGSRIVAASRHLALVDPKRGVLVSVVRPHAGSSWHVDWSPDGHVIASAAQSDGIGLTDDRPIALRLAAQAEADAHARAALTWASEVLATSGRSLGELRDELRRDASLSAEERDARLAALTLAANSPPVSGLGYL